jgi:hypothetical protein
LPDPSKHGVSAAALDCASLKPTMGFPYLCNVREINRHTETAKTSKTKSAFKTPTPPYLKATSHQHSPQDHCYEQLSNANNSTTKTANHKR